MILANHKFIHLRAFASTKNEKCISSGDQRPGCESQLHILLGIRVHAHHQTGLSFLIYKSKGQAAALYKCYEVINYVYSPKHILGTM